jgi:hypothetical protein
MGVKWPVREADHSPASSVEVENAWSYTCTHPYVFTAWYLFKDRLVFIERYLVKLRN